MKASEIKSIFSAGLFKENPIFILFLGMCPSLGVTTTISNALGMAAGVLFVLIFSNIIVSLIRNIVPDQIRIPVFIVIIASLVTILEMLMKAYTPDLYNSLGLFIPLIVVNCLILGRAEAFASKNGVFASIMDAIAMALGFGLGLVSIAFVREVLGTGMIATGEGESLHVIIRFFPEQFAIPLFNQPGGAFLTIGLIVGTIATYKNYKTNKQAEKEAQAAKELAAATKLNKGVV